MRQSEFVIEWTREVVTERIELNTHNVVHRSSYLNKQDRSSGRLSMFSNEVLQGVTSRVRVGVIVFREKVILDLWRLFEIGT